VRARLPVWVLLVPAGCSTDLVFRCERSADCDRPGEPGVCQPPGFCSVRDASCPEGWRFVVHAPEAQARRCVDHGPLLGHWTFDARGEGTAADSSGHDRDGELVRGVTWADGVVGGGVAFDGIDDRVEVASVPPFELASFGAFAWVRGHDDGVQARVVGVDFTDEYAYVNFGGGAPFLEAYDAEHAWWGAGVNPGTAVGDDTWHHLGFVIDREVGETRFYVDGAFESRFEQPSSAAFGTAEQDGVFLIGGMGDNEVTSIEATIDEVRLYGAALAEDAVRAVFEGDRPPGP